MSRHIRGWYGLSSCHGSLTRWTEELPDDWDSMTDADKDAYLDEAAEDHLNNVLECGAELVEGGASA